MVRGIQQGPDVVAHIMHGYRGNKDTLTAKTSMINERFTWEFKMNFVADARVKYNDLFSP